MGQYKVPQNVEAEDKILGPLTFRQFIYALIGVGWGLICFGLLNKIPALMIIIGAPPVMLFLLLAFYSRDGQNFEQLLIAMVGFFAAPRRRLWVKEQVAETFHVEPTKKIAELTQRNSTQVRSELEKLGNLIDSRGWNRPPEADTSLVMPTTTHDQRIAVPALTAQQTAEEQPKSDMLDLKQSPLAQNLAALLQQAAEDVRTEALSQMTAKARPAANPYPSLSISGVTAAPASDILKLATQSDDITVSQIAAQATRLAPAPSDGQMVEMQQSAS